MLRAVWRKRCNRRRRELPDAQTQDGLLGSAATAGGHNADCRAQSSAPGHQASFVPRSSPTLPGRRQLDRLAGTGGARPSQPGLRNRENLMSSVPGICSVTDTRFGRTSDARAGSLVARVLPGRAPATTGIAAPRAAASVGIALSLARPVLHAVAIGRRLT